MTNIMLTHVKISIEPGIREFYFLNIAKYLKIKNKINKKDRQEKKRQKQNKNKTKTKTNTKMPPARTVPQSNKKIVETARKLIPLTQLPLTSLAWYRRVKNGGDTLVL